MSFTEQTLLIAKRFAVVRRRFATPQGKQCEHDSVQHPGAVTIVPILPDGRVCLIRNYRVAVGQTLIELPAGTLEPGEPPAQTAARELQEETGYVAGKIERLAEILMSPGILNERMHLFLASGLTPGPTALEAGEQIEPLVVDWDAALAMVLDGTIQDAKTVAALLYHEQARRQRGERP